MSTRITRSRGWSSKHAFTPTKQIRQFPIPRISTLTPSQSSPASLSPLHHDDQPPSSLTLAAPSLLHRPRCTVLAAPSSFSCCTILAAPSSLHRPRCTLLAPSSSLHLLIFAPHTVHVGSYYWLMMARWSVQSSSKMATRWRSRR